MKTPPDQARLALAEATAQMILLHERIMEPPVPVKELLEQFAIVHPFDHQAEPSFCLEHDLIWEVFINPSLSKHSISFIQAHVMGHLLMNHLHYYSTPLTPAQHQLLNQEADHFANSLLIPELWLHAVCEKNHLNESVAACLSGVFHVTTTTMKNRLRHLGIRCGCDFHNWRRLYETSRLHDLDDHSHSLMTTAPTANDDYCRH